MKKIVFDLTATQPVNGSKFHGGGIYGEVVFKHLVAKDVDCLAVYYDNNAYIDSDILDLIDKHGIKVYLKKDMGLSEAAKCEAGIVYSPLFKDVDPSVTLVTTIHGLRDMEMPSDFYEKYYVHKQKFVGRIAMALGLSTFRRKWIEKNAFLRMKKMYEQAFKSPNTHIVTVSNHSKYSMLSYFSELQLSDINVYYSPSTTKDTDISGYTNLYGKYWLMVSADRWQKNSIRGIMAFDQLFCERPSLEGKVVLTGLSSWDNLRYKPKHLDRFILLGYVDNLELKSLYHHAHAFVYPSLNEGFGYPPLEAMHEGCPVIASAIASIPEVCGDAALYVCPYCIDEIKGRILMLEDQTLRSVYSIKGSERHKTVERKQKKDLESLCDYILSFL